MQHTEVACWFFFLFVYVSCICVMRVHIIQVLKCVDCTCLHFGNPNLCICGKKQNPCPSWYCLCGRPWEHSSTCQWALPVLFCCTSHILDYPVPIVPWTSQLPIPLPGAQLVLTSTPAKWWTQPSPLCIARAVHGCFCSYSFGVKLKQAIKEKLSCPIYTNQWRDLHLS